MSKDDLMKNLKEIKTTIVKKDENGNIIDKIVNTKEVESNATNE